MRISDWSSDVCSADLLIPQQQRSKTMKFNPYFNADHKMMVTGSFNPTPEAPTCNGREMDWTALTELPKQETVKLSKQVMSALWNAPCPTHLGHHPKIACADDLIEALNNGWAYNANEADTIFTFFGDIRPVVCGDGTLAVDHWPQTEPSFVPVTN